MLIDQLLVVAGGKRSSQPTNKKITNTQLPEKNNNEEQCLLALNGRTMRTLCSMYPSKLGYRMGGNDPPSLCFGEEVGSLFLFLQMGRS